jgi:acetyltransferase
MPQENESLARLLQPRGIALVGVKGGEFDPTARDSMARRFLENLQRHGYRGAIHPVNPRYETVGGLTCYPSVTAIPGDVDAALLAVPKARIADMLVECGARGVKAAVVISSGFAEAGPEGRADELAILALARSHGIRLLGPNCFGFYNSHACVNLFGSASLLTRPMLPGRIGFVTQSGALAASVVDRAQERGIGFSYVITTGNQADINNVECVEHLVEDENTHVIALFAEGLGHAARFRAAMQRAAELGKPCLVLKTGSSEVGRQAALAHTGSLAGDDAVYDAVFRQDGVIRCQDPEELFLGAALLSNHCGTVATGAGARLAVISMSGAMGGLLADGAARFGIPMADLTPETRQALLAVPGVSGSLNPLDAAMSTWSGGFGAVGELAGMLARDPGVDVVMLALSGLPYAERVVDDSAAAVRAAGKVFVPMWAGDHNEMDRAVVRLAGEGVTVYDTAADALRALHALSMYRRYQHSLGRGRVAADQPRVDHARIAAARRLLESAGPALAEHPSKQLLALYGVGIPREEVADSADAAVAAAGRIGYPVALKIHSPDIAHKTEAGGLRLGLANPAQVKVAYAAVMANAVAYRPDARLDGVLVAPMAAAGLEMIVGAYQDAEFGPVLLAGMGGVLVEVLRDTALRVAPLSSGQALFMLDELKGSALLDGVRGQMPADRAAVAGVLAALSTMMLELREWIAEVDINPLIVHADGRGATVADALVVLR